MKLFKMGEFSAGNNSYVPAILLGILLSPLMAVLVVGLFFGGSGFAGAVTTISTDVVTGGNLQASSTLLVTGNATFYAGSSFNAATTTDSLYVGGLAQLTGATASGTALVIGNDVPLFRNAVNQLRLQGILSVSNGGTFNAATTTDSLYVGGLTQLTGATASGTALVIGNDIPLFRSAANVLTLQAGLTLTNSGALTVAGNISLQSGETIGNSTDGNVFINTSGLSVATSTATTTRSLYVSAPAGTATSSISVSGAKGSRGACLELHQENVSYRLYVSASTTAVSSNGFILQVEPGSCVD